MNIYMSSAAVRVELLADVYVYSYNISNEYI